MILYELRQKEVINCRDGIRLGNICDIEFDICSGKICNFIIPKSYKVCGLIGKNEEYVIPFQCVKTIGKDTIIIDVDIKHCCRK